MFAGLQLYASRLIPAASAVYRERGNVLRIRICEPFMLPGGSPLHRGRLPLCTMASSHISYQTLGSCSTLVSPSTQPSLHSTFSDFEPVL